MSPARAPHGIIMRTRASLLLLALAGVALAVAIRPAAAETPPTSARWANGERAFAVTAP